MAPSSPTKKSPILTLSELVSHDDVLTDVLVDNLYFWTTIRKNGPRYLGARSVKEEQIADIIRHHIIYNTDLPLAMHELEKLPCLKSYIARLRPQSKVDHFRKHLEKYISTYLPECPFEVTTTNRYEIHKKEASVTARKKIKSGEKIKNLTGHRVVLSPEELSQLEKNGRNFSIVSSSYSKKQAIFLGPARFANHDCEPNAKLVPVGQVEMEIHARRTIQQDDEITVSYGENYFGENNCDCLCATCESYQRNGWANGDASQGIQSRSGTPNLMQSIEVTHLGYSLRSVPPKRKYPFEIPLISRPSTPDLPFSKRRRTATPRVGTLKHELSQTPICVGQISSLDNGAAKEAEAVLEDEGSMSQNNANQEDPSIPVQRKSTVAVQISVDSSPLIPYSPETEVVDVTAVSTQLKVSHTLCLMAQEVSDESDSVSSKVAAVFSPPSPHSTTGSSTAADGGLELVTEDEITLKSNEVDDVVIFKANLVSRASELLVNDAILARDLTSSEPATISSPQEIVQTKRSTQTLTLSSSLDLYVARVPRDYRTNKGLLATPGSAWLTCTTCTNEWIQENAHEPRAECPRCERHSKLYGFVWPKTEREGPGDKEERILDHREVDRLLQPRKKWDDGSWDPAKKGTGLYKGWNPSAAAEEFKKSLKKTVIKSRVMKKKQKKQKDRSRR